MQIKRSLVPILVYVFLFIFIGGYVLKNTMILLIDATENI